MSFLCKSPRRQLALEEWVGKTLEGEHRTRLKSLCRTRWIERHDAFEVFIDFFEPMVCYFEKIMDSDEWNSATRADAHSLYLPLSRFPFIIALNVIKDVLAYIKALSKKLQGCYIDIVKAYREVGFVMSTLRSGVGVRRLETDEDPQIEMFCTCFSVLRQNKLN